MHLQRRNARGTTQAVDKCTSELSSQTKLRSWPKMPTAPHKPSGHCKRKTEAREAIEGCRSRHRRQIRPGGSIRRNMPTEMRQSKNRQMCRDQKRAPENGGTDPKEKLQKCCFRDLIINKKIYL